MSPPRSQTLPAVFTGSSDARVWGRTARPGELDQAVSTMGRHRAVEPRLEARLPLCPTRAPATISLLSDSDPRIVGDSVFCPSSFLVLRPRPLLLACRPASTWALRCQKGLKPRRLGRSGYRFWKVFQTPNAGRCASQVERAISFPSSLAMARRRWFLWGFRAVAQLDLLHGARGVLGSASESRASRPDDREGRGCLRLHASPTP